MSAFGELELLWVALLEIGADYLLGVSTDSLGVQRVHRYRLSR